MGGREWERVEKMRMTLGLHTPRQGVYSLLQASNSALTAIGDIGFKVLVVEFHPIRTHLDDLPTVLGAGFPVQRSNSQ